MSKKKNISTQRMKLVFALIPLLLINCTHSTTDIGGYKIEDDKLKNKYCEGFDFSGFHDVKDIETKYDSYYLKKIVSLKDDLFKFIKESKTSVSPQLNFFPLSFEI